MSALGLLRRTVATAISPLIGRDRPRSVQAPRPAPAAIALDISDEAAGADRILIFADAYGATQELSFVAPLAARRASGEVSITLVREAALDAFDYRSIAPALAALWERARPTAVVLSRIATRHVGAIVSQARSSGVPIICHLDDDLFAVPAELGGAKAARHNDPARLSRLTIACMRADAIYASTPRLAAALRARFPDREVIGGEIYAAAAEPFAPYRPAEPAIVGYMGTGGHVADLEAIAPAIAYVLDQRPAVRFETFGTIQMPQTLQRFGERVVSHGKTADYASFLAKLKTLGWAAGLAPLLPSDFNACKADTKFVEYAQAGIPAVLADSPVYSAPLEAEAALAARSAEDWEAAICRLLDDGAKTLESAQALLREQYSLQALEQQLLQVLRREPTRLTS